MSVMKQGSSGAEVVAVQNKLKEIGFDPNGVDGNFGPGTAAALIAFQQSKGLTPDGKAGPQTLAALGLGDSGASVNSSGSAAAETGGGAGTGATANAGVLNLAGLTGRLPASVIAQIPDTAQKFGITTNLRLAHFLAQCALESKRFTDTEEDLHYSAKRLKEVFPKYFKNVDPAIYANNPAKLANRVYANRNGNGNEASGDGFRFRGRGYIQLTGRTNYTSFTNFVGEDCVGNPDLVSTTFPLASAAFYFKSNNIWPVCDRGSDNATVTAVSRLVNGENPHAVPERIKFFREFKQALG
jgi:putative chitinase